jgi:hypothetical protein
MDVTTPRRGYVVVLAATAALATLRKRSVGRDPIWSGE